MAALASVPGSRPTVAEVVAIARVSRKTFYELFENRDDCLLATVDYALGLISSRASDGYAGGEGWDEAIRGALTELLLLLDAEPALARLSVLQSAAAGPAVLERRNALLRRMAAAIDEGRVIGRRQPCPLMAEGLVAGALNVITMQLLSPDPEPLVALVNPLMSSIVLPYLGDAAAGAQLRRRPVEPVRSAPGSYGAIDDQVPIRLTARTAAVIEAVSGEPGLSNSDVGRRVGITDPAQISKLLARLAQFGLAENTASDRPLGAANSWHLTEMGRAVERAIRRADGVPTTERSGSLARRFHKLDGTKPVEP